MAKTIKITQTRSAIGRLPKHKATLLGLGLRRIGHTVEREDTPAVRGMVNAVSFMVKVEGVRDAFKILCLPAEGSKKAGKRAWVVVSVLASVKPVVVVTKVRNLVLAVAYVAVSRVVRCLCTVVCRNSASLLVKR